MMLVILVILKHVLDVSRLPWSSYHLAVDGVRSGAVLQTASFHIKLVLLLRLKPGTEVGEDACMMSAIPVLGWRLGRRSERERE